MNITNENWLHKLFIDEAKPALERHSGTGGEEGFIDVTELPADGIDQDKVYRLIESTEPICDIYIVSSLLGNGTYKEVQDRIYASEGRPNTVSVTIYEVDEFPSNGEAMGAVGDVITCPTYVKRSTGEAGVFVTSDRFVFLTEATGGLQCKGIVSSISDTTEEGYYFVTSPGGTSTHYGIPNEDGTKKVYEHTSETIASWWTLNHCLLRILMIPRSIERSRKFRQVWMYGLLIVKPAQTATSSIFTP